MSSSNRQLLLFQQHLVQYLGPPSEVLEVSGSPIPDSPVQVLNVAYFAPEGSAAPVAFATCGLSQFIADDGRRIEGLILMRGQPSEEGYQAVNHLLAQFALFTQSQPGGIHVGDIVRAENELRQFSNMTTVLFLPPIPFVPEFHRAQIAQDTWADLLWLVPVFDAEAAYVEQYGPQALMMLFAAQNLDVTDVRRSSADTTMPPEQAEQAARQAAEELSNQPAKPNLGAKSNRAPRRRTGQGSFQVDEGNDELRVTRGGTRKASAHPGSSTQRPGSAMSKKPRTPNQGVRVDVPKSKQTVRFDLGASGGKVQKKVSKEPPPIQISKPQPEPTPEEKAEARRRRVEELKATAKEVAARAAARRAQAATPGREPASSPAPTPSVPKGPADSKHLRAASRRRGAPKRISKTTPVREEGGEGS